jgi:hypothetical protein
MARSRSSFDLAGAIATATSLSTTTAEEAPAAKYRGMTLVSFGPAAPDPPPAALVDPPSNIGEAPAESSQASDPRRPPRLPDLSQITSPTQRCEHIVRWIVEAVGAEDVFLADASGLPIAGALGDAEARLAASGVVASAVAHLSACIPGNTASIFELHLGEGPFFQLIGFEVSGAIYLVGLTRTTPLTFRQAHAVRLACRHALGEVRADGSAGGA